MSAHAHQPAPADSPVVAAVRLAAALCEHWAGLALRNDGLLAASATERAQQRSADAFALVGRHVASNGGVA